MKMREILRLVLTGAIVILTVYGCCQTVKFMHQLTEIDKEDHQNYQKNYDYENVREYLYE